MKVSVIEMDEKYYVPVKYVFELNKLDFNNSMLYFNSFKFDIERVDINYGNVDYMCFTVFDFIRFVIIVSVLNKKIESYAKKIISILEKNNFKVLNRKGGDLQLILDKYVRKPEPGEKGGFIMVKELMKKMNKEDLSYFGNSQIIGRTLKLKYKRFGKRVGGSTRYGYEVILIK